MRVLVAGDFCDNYRVTNIIRNKEYNQLFENVKSIISCSDYSIVNFECPIVEGKESPIPKCGPNLKGQKEAADALKYAGFNICTLANNHIMDHGSNHCMNTKRILESSGFKTVGIGNNIDSASNILYLNRNNEILAIINCCEHEFSVASDNSCGANPLDTVQIYYQISEAKRHADYILVIVHGGFEHYQYPSLRMKLLYRYFIDIGADAVINHHQHCSCGYEFYKNKPISYGIGNFCFDWPGHINDIWNYGYFALLDFTKTKIDAQYIPFIQNAEKLGVYPLSEKQLSNWNSQMSSINKNLKNDSFLVNNLSIWHNSDSSQYSLCFEPYQGRILNGLYRRGLLPRCLSRKKILKLIDFISCESHFERILLTLKNY